jgi:hypothetical protein
MEHKKYEHEKLGARGRKTANAKARRQKHKGKCAKLKAPKEGKRASAKRSARELESASAKAKKKHVPKTGSQVPVNKIKVVYLAD